MTVRTRCLLVALLGMAACSKTSPMIRGDAGSDVPDAAASSAVEDVIPRAAQAICGALFRCCDDDLALYFAPMRENELLAEFRDRLPPAAALDEQSCREVMTDILDVVPLGDWVRAVQHGEVAYDAAAFDACVGTLQHASCGAQARAALWDTTCLGVAAPAGGAMQRSFFRRTRGVGQACTPIRDGIGAAFYGTCDPTTSFCCYPDTAHQGCQMPFDASGIPRGGTCKAVSATGAACSPTLPIQLCATGNDCDADSLTCLAPSAASLSVGDACIDAGYHDLGTCQHSWCDVLGTKRCEAYRADGAACTGDDECESGRCQTVCVANTVCVGDAGPSGPDAGVSDAGVDSGQADAANDSGSADAGVDAASTESERCSDAQTLTATAPSPITGYASRRVGSLGTADDYNPKTSSGLPPHCSVVYDARGLDRVYSVTLSPGERIRLRLELSGGKRAAIYLLDSCPGGSWPDFDMSGACGSNEYAAGWCGVTGCDPATLDVLYPTMLGGQPTQPATFWVVVDQIDGTDASGFTLDWKIVP